MGKKKDRSLKGEQGEIRPGAGGNNPYESPEDRPHPDGQLPDPAERHRMEAFQGYHRPDPAFSREEQFRYYTDRRYLPETPGQTYRYLREVQTFLGNEVLLLEDFLKDRGLLEEYIRSRYPACCDCFAGGMPFK